MNPIRNSFAYRQLMKKAFCLLLLCCCLAAGTPVTAQGGIRTNAPPKVELPQKAPRNVPVVTPDVGKLPWTMEDGVKVFHLSADIVKRELLPASPMAKAKVVDVWGFNGSVPGPTIEVNEGDRVRIHFKNNLPEETTVHWHGLEIPVNMDGMPYISQPPVKTGGTYIYEFTLRQNGTFFYHSHGAMQEMMGMLGFFIIHPKVPHRPACQKDFALALQEFAVLPNNPIPNSMNMEFNWLTINGKVAPATTPMIVRQGERVRLRFINIGMDHHPLHIHGHQFYVTGTEGGRIPESAWFPGNTVLVGVAQARDIEFDAKQVGDWMLHCHLPHHMMNNMASTVGPIAEINQGGKMHTGLGMEEGMGIVRQGHALDEDLGPSFGRGMGPSAEREIAKSNAVGPRDTAPMPGTPQTRMDHSSMPGMSNNQGGANTAGMSGMQGHEGMAGMGDPQGSAVTPKAPAGEPNAGMAPGYPQDEMMMMMKMDASVAKPETNRLAPGWSAALQGMMSLVRILPPAEYDRMMADIRAGRVEQPGEGSADRGSMDHSKMNMQGAPSNRAAPMDHSKMNMQGAPSNRAAPMDHSKMNMQGAPSNQAAPMDHSKMNMQGAPSNQAAPMDHSKMNMQSAPSKAAPMDHRKMNMQTPRKAKPQPAKLRTNSPRTSTKRRAAKTQAKPKSVAKPAVKKTAPMDPSMPMDHKM